MEKVLQMKSKAGTGSDKSILQLASEAEKSFSEGARVWVKSRTGRGSKIRKLAKWPLVNEALGVMPEQVEEARERYSKCGVPTDFTKDGRAVITGPGHYRKAMNLMGYVDRG